MRNQILWLRKQFKKRPILVSIISINYYLLAVEIIIDRKHFSHTGFIFLALCLVVLGYGLWSLNNWARIAIIILAYIQIASAIFITGLNIYFLHALPGDLMMLFIIITTTINIIIIIYFNMLKIKNAFISPKPRISHLS